MAEIAIRVPTIELASDDDARKMIGQRLPVEVSGHKTWGNVVKAIPSRCPSMLNPYHSLSGVYGLWLTVEVP